MYYTTFLGIFVYTQLQLGICYPQNMKNPSILIRDGIIFKSSGTLISDSVTWNVCFIHPFHHLEKRYGSISESLMKLYKYTDLLPELRTIIEKSTSHFEQLSTLRTEFQTLTNQNIMKNDSFKRRPKRLVGLVVSSIASFLLGLHLGGPNLDKIEDSIRNNNDAIMANTHLINHTFSLINTLNNNQKRFNSFISFAEENFHNIHNKIANLESKTEVLFFLQTYITLIHSDILSLSGEYEHIIQMVSNINNGAVTSEILQPSVLKQSLEEIQQTLPSELTLPCSTPNYLHICYSMLRVVKIYLDKNHLLVGVHFPVYRSSSTFRIFEILPLLLPTTHDKLFSYVPSSYKYLAISQSQSSFILTDSFNNYDCYNVHVPDSFIKLCRITPSFHTYNSSYLTSCEVALFYNQFSFVRTLCKPHLTNTFSSLIFPLSVTEWFLNFPPNTSVALSYRNQSTSYTYPTFPTLAHVQPGCTIRVSDNIISSPQFYEKTFTVPYPTFADTHLTYPFSSKINQTLTLARNVNFSHIYQPNVSKLDTGLDQLYSELSRLSQQEVKNKHFTVQHYSTFTILIFFLLIVLSLFVLYFCFQKNTSQKLHTIFTKLDAPVTLPIQPSSPSLAILNSPPSGNRPITILNSPLPRNRPTQTISNAHLVNFDEILMNE